MSAAEDAASPEFEEAVAGEDEPAAEPMIDLVEEAIIVEELLAEEEPIAEPAVEEIAAVETPHGAHEPAIADVPMDGAIARGRVA